MSGKAMSSETMDEKVSVTHDEESGAESRHSDASKDKVNGPSSGQRPPVRVPPLHPYRPIAMLRNLVDDFAPLHALRCYGIPLDWIPDSALSLRWYTAIQSVANACIQSARPDAFLNSIPGYWRRRDMDLVRSGESSGSCIDMSVRWFFI